MVGVFIHLLVQENITMSCAVMNDKKRHRKHVTKALQTAGMVSGSQDGKDALLPQTIFHS